MEEQELLQLVHNKIGYLNAAKRAKKDYIHLEDEVRKLVFVPKQKLSIIRKWFNLLSYTQLNNNELEIVKSVIVKPKKTVWQIIIKIILYQKQLSTSEMKKWFDYITDKMDIKLAGLSIFDDKRINNADLKIYIYEKLLTFPEYFSQVLALLDTEMRLYYEDFMEICFNKIIDMINKNDEISKLLLIYWKLSTFFDIFAEKKKISSIVLFESTGKSQYLPKEVKDVFIF